VTIIWQLAIEIVVAWLLIRFVRNLSSFRAVTDNPADAIEDPYAGVRSPTKRGPPGRAGAVALEESDEQVDSSFPPRQL
jgi:hypothetical protein